MQQNFALYFRKAIDSQLALQNSVTVTVEKVILDNNEIKSLIHDEIKRSAWDWLKQFMRKIGWATGAVIGFTAKIRSYFY